MKMESRNKWHNAGSFLTRYVQGASDESIRRALGVEAGRQRVVTARLRKGPLAE